MGQDYSHQQKVEFNQFRKIIDLALKDQEPWDAFHNSFANISKHIQNKHE